MTMSPWLRKLMLSIHLVLSIGWIGAVIAYLALDVAAVATPPTDTSRAALVAMELLIRTVIVPLAVASLVTGLVMALGTPWGLIRHYWVVFSLILTVLAVVVLVSHVPDVTALAHGEDMTSPAHGGGHGGDQQRSGPAGDFLHAGGGLVVLLAVTVLNVFKPRGLTPYGWRKQYGSRTSRDRVAPER
jgi:uncharacterized membrane protein